MVAYNVLRLKNVAFIEPTFVNRRSKCIEKFSIVVQNKIVEKPKKLIFNELKFNFESLKMYSPALFLSPLSIVIIDILHIVKNILDKRDKNKNQRSTAVKME